MVKIVFIATKIQIFANFAPSNNQKYGETSEKS